MTDLAVVIPSWDYQRALTQIRVMHMLQHLTWTKYILIIPGCEAHYDNITPDLREWLEIEAPEITTIETADYLSPVEAMARAGQALQMSGSHPGPSPGLFLFLHDDVQVLDQGWDSYIVRSFASRPKCGLAGFGGGTAFGDPDIYKIPYDYRQLARYGFVSNMKEAESHGERGTEPVRVAALDGFSLITTREFYERIGGWSACLSRRVFFHEYDAWISCMAARHGYEVWMLPFSCHHAGGGTSVRRATDYTGVLHRLGYSTPEELYMEGHRVIYEEFIDVLPIRAPL